MSIVHKSRQRSAGSVTAEFPTSSGTNISTKSVHRDLHGMGSSCGGNVEVARDFRAFSVYLIRCCTECTESCLLQFVEVKLLFCLFVFLVTDVYTKKIRAVFSALIFHSKYIQISSFF